MLTVSFVQEMLLAYTGLALTTVIDRMNEQLWPYTADVLRRKSAINNVLVPLADPSTGIDRVVDVLAVIYNGTFLPRAVELRLDALAPNWRVAPTGTPETFLFSGEVPVGNVRLYPPPAQVVDVNLLVLIQPPIETIVPWARLLTGLKAIDYATTSDPVRARLGLSEFVKPLIALVEGSVHDIR